MFARRLRDKLPDAFVLSVMVVVLTGCASMSPPRPVDVTLDRSELAVRLSNGQICRGTVGLVPAANGRMAVAGAGPLTGCDATLDYMVRGEAARAPGRIVLEEVLAAIGLEDAIAPLAEVEITAPDGRRWVFASPRSRDA